jgi:cell division protein FtsI/penicillin-binding protein 2
MKLVEVFGAFANGGTLVQPRLVWSIQRPDGREDRSGIKAARTRMLSADTIRDLTQMMVTTIDDGTGRRARIPGYTVAGKTGTAQIPDPTGGYSDETVHAFIAFTPYTDQQFVVLIKLDRPIGVRFSETSVVPVARELMEFILQYYSVAPDRQIEN